MVSALTWQAMDTLTRARQNAARPNARGGQLICNSPEHDQQQTTLTVSQGDGEDADDRMVIYQLVPNANCGLRNVAYKANRNGST